MIGARRPFLDPVEMALFNSSILAVLAITGVLPLIYTEIDKVIGQIEKGESPTLPRIVIDKNNAIQAADFSNPYAKNKALAAHEICKTVASLTVEGCFKVKEREEYMPLVGAAHEMMRHAMLLADEAREIEKNGNTVIRRPHAADGTVLSKRDFIAKA